MIKTLSIMIKDSFITLLMGFISCGIFLVVMVQLETVLLFIGDAIGITIVSIIGFGVICKIFTKSPKLQTQTEDDESTV